MKTTAIIILGPLGLIEIVVRLLVGLAMICTLVGVFVLLDLCDSEKNIYEPLILKQPARILDA